MDSITVCLLFFSDIFLTFDLLVVCERVQMCAYCTMHIEVRGQLQEWILSSHCGFWGIILGSCEWTIFISESSCRPIFFCSFFSMPMHVFSSMVETHLSFFLLGQSLSPNNLPPNLNFHGSLTSRIFSLFHALHLPHNSQKWLLVLEGPGFPLTFYLRLL